MQYGLKEQHIIIIQNIFAKYAEIDEAILYGSRAKGDYKNGSDIDLTLKGEKLNYSLLGDIQMELDDTYLPYQIDVSIYRCIDNPKLIDHIDRIGISFYKKKTMSEWKEVKLGNLIEVKYGKDHKKLLDGTIPCIGSGGVMRYVNSFIYDKVSILIPRKGSLNNIMFKDKPFWTVDTMFWSKINDEIVKPKFLYYQLTLIDYINLNVGSAVPSLTVPVINDIDINLPPYPEQQAIAEVLSSLDDKIDLLHRQNKTLEQMAETLFKQWFIEEAKEEWKEGKLGDILTVKGGSTPSTKNKDFWNGDIYWTTPKDITNLTSIYLFDTDRKITKKGLAKISSGLLPKGTLLMSSRAPVGCLAFAEIPLAINQGYIAILDNKGWSKKFIYLWLKINKEYIISNSNGSTFLEISKSTFKNLDIILPPQDLYAKFLKKVISFFEKIKNNQIQIRTLEKMRDTLLPKLMSGEVRVI